MTMIMRGDGELFLRAQALELACLHIGHVEDRAKDHDSAATTPVAVVKPRNASIPNAVMMTTFHSLQTVWQTPIVRRFRPSGESHTGSYHGAHNGEHEYP
jgi:hypothetical protein